MAPKLARVQSPGTNPDPENMSANRNRLATRLRRTLRDKGFDIVPGPLVAALVDLVTDETKAVRTRIADRIIAAVIGRYETFDDERLELLGNVVKTHYLDDDNEIRLLFGDEPSHDVKG
jgi:hypothetical protein